jgi:hypothetical protein
VPEGIVYFHIVEREHTHGDRALLIVTNSDETALFGYDTYHIALLDTLVKMMDSTRENPRMET